MAAEETLALFYFVFSSPCPPSCTSPCPYPPSHRSSLSWQLLLAAREPFPVVSKEDGFPQVQVSNHKLVVVFHHHPLPTTSYWLLTPSPPPSGLPPLSSCQAAPSCCWWRSSPASPSDLANQNIIVLHFIYYVYVYYHIIYSSSIIFPTLPTPSGVVARAASRVFAIVLKRTADVSTLCQRILLIAC